MIENVGRDFIELIADEKLRQKGADLRKGLRLLAEELDSKDLHSILELNQDAEDHRYTIPKPDFPRAGNGLGE